MTSALAAQPAHTPGQGWLLGSSPPACPRWAPGPPGWARGAHWWGGTCRRARPHGRLLPPVLRSHLLQRVRPQGPSGQLQQGQCPGPPGGQACVLGAPSCPPGVRTHRVCAPAPVGPGPAQPRTLAASSPSHQSLSLGWFCLWGFLICAGTARPGLGVRALCKGLRPFPGAPASSHPLLASHLPCSGDTLVVLPQSGLVGPQSTPVRHPSR